MGVGLGLGLSDRQLVGQIVARGRPGDTASLGAATFTRADAATCARQLDANGIYQLALANVLRSTHYVGGIRTILLEAARTAASLGACTYAVGTYWGRLASWTVSAAASSCIAAETAYKHLYAAGVAFRDQTVGIFVNGQTDIAWAIFEQSNNAVESYVAINDLTASLFLTRVKITWATHVVSLINGTGAFGKIDLGNGRYCVWCAGTGTGAGAGAGGNTRQVLISPDDQGVVGNGAIVHGAGLVANTTFPLTPIVTLAAGVTQAIDALSYAGVAGTGAATLFYRYWDLATQAWVNLAAAYTFGNPIVPAIARAYADIVVLNGTLTTNQAAAILGY